MGARLERYPRARRASDAVDGATHASVTAIAIATRAFDRIARAWACGERTMMGTVFGLEPSGRAGVGGVRVVALDRRF